MYASLFIAYKKHLEGDIMTNEKNELLKYYNDLSQVYGIKDYTYNDGKAKGMRALEVKNGKGLVMTVLPDRCLDIAELYYKGIKISFNSKTGLVSPQLYTENGVKGFLASFNGGFLTTCGLTYVGSPCEDNGENLGLHGSIANTPAQHVCAEILDCNNEDKIRISGEVKQTVVFGEHLRLKREILCETEKNTFFISNTVENRGYEKQPLMCLFHFNLGYPLLSEHSKLYLSANKAVPRDENAKIGLQAYDTFEKPVIGYDEQVFFHTCDNEHKECSAILFNEELSIAIVINYNSSQCPWLIEWKCMKAGDYALGLEPANCHVYGRKAAREDGTLKYINPGEVKQFNFSICVLDDKEQIEGFIKRTKDERM